MHLIRDDSCEFVSIRVAPFESGAQVSAYSKNRRFPRFSYPRLTCAAPRENMGYQLSYGRADV